MAKHNPLQQLSALGQSVWLDYIDRDFVRRGSLAQLLAADGVTGLTSNPAIFGRAIASGAYQSDIDKLVRARRSPDEIVEALIVEDIRAAADLLAPIYERTQGRDGFVSLEVNPHLARDPDATYRDAMRLWSLVGRENLMIKVPGSQQVLTTITRLVAEGINVNITLLFSVERYAAVAEAYIAGLEQRVARKLPIDRVASVASFFLSRIDSYVDARLAALKDEHAQALMGRSATICARAAYAHYQSLVEEPRWLALARRGGRTQRLLWASTSAKNPAYSDLKYVEPLIGPDTITTLPPETLIAYRDHGMPMRRLPEAPSPAPAELVELARQLAEFGVNWHAVGPQLGMEGLNKFIEPYDAMFVAVRSGLFAIA